MRQFFGIFGNSDAAALTAVAFRAGITAARRGKPPDIFDFDFPFLPLLFILFILFALLFVFFVLLFFFLR